jgi:hypothetical protein
VADRLDSRLTLGGRQVFDVAPPRRRNDREGIFNQASAGAVVLGSGIGVLADGSARNSGDYGDGGTADRDRVPRSVK